jgi:GT2 family glycosyltransferase
MKKVTAIVATFNRLDFLKEIVDALQNQTYKIDNIVVTNNSSVDGTEEWLNTRSDIISQKQENVGSSGGQYSGMKKALETDCDYIWMMDDDVVPVPNCLEELMKATDTKKIVAPVRYDKDGELFWNETIRFNLKNPFKSIWNGINNREYFTKQGNLVYTEGLTFEGPLFHRSIVDLIGFPEFNFFIYGDDSEYMIRAVKNGIGTYLVKSAKLNRKLEVPNLHTSFGWKHYYIIRNIIAIDKLHGNFWVSKLRPYFYKMRWLQRAKSIDEKKVVINAFEDGQNYKIKFSNEFSSY